MEGFSIYFPYRNLSILSPSELVELFGQGEEDWSSQTLYSCVNAEHGYTVDSQTIHDLISIMFQFTKEERKLFLQFITGSTRLPIGGFKNLKPKLTVVLKHAEDGLTSDQYLPTTLLLP